MGITRAQGARRKGRGNPSVPLHPAPRPLPLRPLRPAPCASRLRFPDVIVVGAGPAGLAAAVQLVRQGIDCVVLEKDRPGGQIATANLVENYLGLYRLSGADIAGLFVKHAMNAGVSIIRAEVRAISKGVPFIVATTKGAWRSRAVVVATGAAPNELDNTGGSVDYDTKDLAIFRGRNVVVLGSGDAAFDRALRIRPVASAVRIICRGKPSALPLLIQRCRKAKIKVVTDAGEPAVRFEAGGFLVRTQKGTFRAERLLSSLGKTARPPALPRPLAGLAPMFPDGRTKVPGLFLVGDLVSGRDRYLSIATGMGIAAAMAIGQWFKKGNGVEVGRAASWK